MRRYQFILVLTLAIAGWPAGVARAQCCVGDVDGDWAVSVAELVQTVRNVLDGQPAASGACAGDGEGAGAVIVADLIAAVRNALSGCRNESDLVVATDWLIARLDDDGVQVIDARVGAFDGGHIPGALPLSPYTLATTVEGVDLQIVGPEEGAAALAAVGLQPDAIVVVYGAAPEFDPARVVWALRYLGHGDVRYLDGGWPAWVAADAPVAPGPPMAAGPSAYEVAAVREEIYVSGDWVLEQLGDPPYDAPAIQVIDARSVAEFAAGRIPTAVHVPWNRNLDEGRLRSPAELAGLYADLGLDRTRTTVVYCLVGWRASFAWLTLTWLGFEDVRVYDGSWLEWGAGGFPIEGAPE